MVPTFCMEYLTEEERKPRPSASVALGRKPAGAETSFVITELLEITAIQFFYSAQAALKADNYAAF